jgi:hypothetical protein
MGVESRPFMFDPIAVGELLEAQASRTDSGSLRPGSRSLLEQVRCSHADCLPPPAQHVWSVITSTTAASTNDRASNRSP